MSPSIETLDTTVWKSLLDLYAYLARPGSDGLFYEGDFTAMSKLGVNPALLRASVRWLRENDWLYVRTIERDGTHVEVHEFTHSGAVLAARVAALGDREFVVAAPQLRIAAADAAYALARIVAQSNQLAADHPERLPMYRASIEAGAGLLRDHAPTRAIVRSSLLDPADWILKQAATAAVRNAADHAIRLLTGLL